MERSEQVQLGVEAQYFHRAFFARPLAPEVVDRYVRANQHCRLAPDAAIETILRNALDVEAIEFALRVRGRGSTLTRKIQILFYLLEVRRDYYHDFVSETPMFGRALISLAGSVAGTGWKLAKGTWLIWRHGLG
ncbi:MAG: hypothetical protein NTY38_23240 [Acidobacteria bacterium]|nr:hypothetical protein [Acidobacteriota bacterium]